MNRKIVHISVDEKFINSAVSQFSSLNLENEFFILTKNKKTTFKYINPRAEIIPIYANKANLKDLSNKIINAIVIFHGLSYPSALIIHFFKKSQNNKLVWFVWGAEFYFNPHFFKGGKYAFLGELSTKIERQFETKNKLVQLKEKFKNKIIQTFYGGGERSKLMKNVMCSFDVIASPFIEEVNLIQSKTLNQSAYIKFTYYPLELIVGSENKFVSSENILIGNSASSSNNHFEVFRILENFTIQNKNLICPLSYGNHDYTEIVVSEGEKQFGQNFMALRSFMPIEEYNKILLNCGVVIMNHYRSQAFGNIVFMLFVGSKIYLDERNTIYIFLKNLGVYIFSIQKDLTQSNPDALKLLSAEQMLYNRRLIEQYLNKDNLFDTLKSEMAKLMQ